ncbi:unnamed protein product [Acanthoscelides obtectus]|uniref:Phosphopantothenoylcysteine decarboxylase n=1 Tax=Acanthoscelides obtectus TaxID=200917 RepID=A0A9P0KTM3_ACAOB|nr:unnamed protein product [Acanthoscelides obtectus]CAK1631267.1 Phosphopantothenoylcysteine decarboxylase [Acanthoscelides obtectus]
MVNLLIGCTGSVATLKLPVLLEKISSDLSEDQVNLKVCVTESARHFFDENSLPTGTRIFKDCDEWNAWSARGDPVLHIELAKWADIFLIAPLDANTLAKMANGLCDNLLTCIARAWEMSKPLVFCPAMNTKMYQHPLTAQQIDLLKSWGYQEIPVIEKKLICGDTGPGAMAEVTTIVSYLRNIVSENK